MRHFRRISAMSITACLLIALASLSTFHVDAQSMGALERGYRTGYTDGYMAGHRDNIDRASREYRDEEDYRKADRAYVAAYGPLEDYRDGYQQGFEIGYDAGFERRGFDSTVPGNMSRRGVIDVDANAGTDLSGGGSSGTARVSAGDVVVIPDDSVMIVEMLSDLSTEASQNGDSFQARVLGPMEYEGATIDGRVTRVKRPGKVKGTGELQLSFDQIRLPDNRSGQMRAQVIEVIDMGDNTGVGDVDEEGGVKGKSTTSSDVKKVGAATGIGAIIGAIAGGGKGAAIGAAIGGAVGTGGVLATRGKEIRLPRGQQLRIRTDAETVVR